jgi:hypothetical protein
MIMIRRSFAILLVSLAILPLSHQGFSHENPPRLTTFPEGVTQCERDLIHGLVREAIEDGELGRSQAANVFQQSLGPTIFNSFVAFFGASFAVHFAGSSASLDVQGVASAGHSVLSDVTFYRTYVVDVILTFASHWLTLGNHKSYDEALKKLEGVGFTKTGARETLLMVYGAAIINGGWALTGAPMDFDKVLAGTGFAFVAYKFLFAMKRYLFQTYPNRNQQDKFNEIGNRLPGFIRSFEEALIAQSASSDQASSEMQSQWETRKLEFLMNTVSNFPVELAMKNSARSLDLDGRVMLKGLLSLRRQRATLLERVSQNIDSNATHQTSVKLANISKELIEKRLKFVRHVLGLLDSLKIEEEARGALSAGLQIPGLKTDDSLWLHRQLQTHLKDYKKKIYLASVVDQTIAVGVFGGVFLKAMTFYAETGTHYPWVTATFDKLFWVAEKALSFF